MRLVIQHILQSFGIIERILRNRFEYFAATRHRSELPGMIGQLLTITTLGFAILGFVAGLSGGGIGQALLSAIKLPFLFLVSGAVCLPTLYYFSILFGSRLRFLQAWALILTAQTVSAALVMGFAPIAFLFWISGADPLFLVAMNIAVLGLAALLGLIFVVQGVLYSQEAQPPEQVSFFTWLRWIVTGGPRSIVLMGWLVVYGAVGARLSWMLRPFFAVPLKGSGFWSSMVNLISGLVR